MKNIMIDIETMGTRPNSAITSIGAVYFDETGTGRTFYHKVSLHSSEMLGLEIEASTVLWWLQQPEAARKEMTGGDPLYFVLKELKKFIQEDCLIWGNGPAFDNVILENAYRKTNQLPPWKYINNRCFRTIKGLFPDINLPENTNKHNALDDAIWQAKYASKVLKQMATDTPFEIDTTALTHYEAMQFRIMMNKGVKIKNV